MSHAFALSPNRPPAAARSEASYDTLVIGAGQAGLAAAYYLRRAGLRFTVLDANAQVGASWQRRWDSLRLFTPVKYNALPGLAFPGNPYDLPGKDAVAAYFRTYVDHFDLPVQLGESVQSLHASPGGFVVTTAAGEAMHARSVIVATGANQRPYVPAFASDFDRGIVQVHSNDYRNPKQLPDGRVLVVGAGNSGAQIALELAAAGRDVVFSGRETGTLPRRLLGRDIYDWLWPTLMRPSVDSRLGRKLMKGRLFRGDPLVGMPSKTFEVPRLTRIGRIAAVQAGNPFTDDGQALDNLAAVIWCTGFRPDFGWIELPVLGLDGYPRHHRGVATDVPGLAFLGLRYQSRMNSALLGGVGEDAAHVVGRIAAHLRAAAVTEGRG